MTIAGVEVPITWRGRRTQAFVPTVLARRDLEPDTVTVARTAAAASEVQFAAEALDPDFKALARLLLRAEGIASSFIEGISAPVIDVVLADEAANSYDSSAAAWVAANLSAVTGAVIEAVGEAPLSIETLCEWHHALMAPSPTPMDHVGVLRTEQGWIGGSSPLDAHLVTPPPDRLNELLDDLITYVNRDDVDPIIQAAVAHAQFEVIHPFGDGNGRVGRVLVAWLLTRRLHLHVPPPVSAAIATDVGGYAAGLALFCLGQPEKWIQWFADVVGRGGRAQRDLVSRLERVRAGWIKQIEVTERRIRRDATMFKVLDLFPRHLVLSSAIVAAELGVAPKTALGALQHLSRLGVLTQVERLRHETRGQPAALFVSVDLLGLVGSTPLR